MEVVLIGEKEQVVERRTSCGCAKECAELSGRKSGGTVLSTS
jgi:hypothetical protein